MSRSTIEERLTATAERYARRTDTSDVVFAMTQPGRGWQWSSGAVNAPYFVASATKLFTSTLIFQLAEEGVVELDLSLGQYLPSELVTGLNVIDGIDRSDQITVRQLLAHTSGTADYFEQRRNDGSTTFGRALDADFAWSIDEAVRIAKEEIAAGLPAARDRAEGTLFRHQLSAARRDRRAGHRR